MDAPLGLGGRALLREGLSSQNPLDYIVTFQEQNGLATIASRAALPMVCLFVVCTNETPQKCSLLKTPA